MNFQQRKKDSLQYISLREEVFKILEKQSQQSQFLEQESSNSENEEDCKINCEKCKSDPQISGPSYGTHIHQSQQGKTPNNINIAKTQSSIKNETKCPQQSKNDLELRTIDFYSKYKKIIYKQGIITKDRQRIKMIKQTEKKPIYNYHLTTYLQKIGSNFQTLEKIKIMRQTSRNGGLFNCYLDDENNLKTGKDTFINCISVLNIYQNLKDYNSLPLTKLPYLNKQQIQELQELIPQDKTISFDEITHQIHQNCNWKLLKNIWFLINF